MSAIYQLRDMRERIASKSFELRRMAECLATGEPEAIRLLAKASGVDLALSFIDETLRTYYNELLDEVTSDANEAGVWLTYRLRHCGGLTGDAYEGIAIFVDELTALRHANDHDLWLIWIAVGQTIEQAIDQWPVVKDSVQR